jgi:hypothetical protein
MKQRNTLTLIIGSLLFLIFVVLPLHFPGPPDGSGGVSQPSTSPLPFTMGRSTGLKFKLPTQSKGNTFDKRIQNFEDTSNRPSPGRTQPLISVAGWTISNPGVFFSAFPSGSVDEAKPVLEGLVRNAKSGVVGNHPFSFRLHRHEPAKIR